MQLTALLLAAVLSACTGSSAPEIEEIRNLVFIMGDDHAAHVLGCYGNTLVRTPNLDRLAAEGVRFDRAYVNSPVCTPSRQSLITGKLPHAVGVTLLRTPLQVKEVTIADHLKQFGFETAAVGKMHFNADRAQLRQQGFAEDIIDGADGHHGFNHRIDRSDYRRYLDEHPPRRPPQDAQIKPPWRPFRDPARIWLNADALPVGVYDEDSEGTYFARRAIEFLRENRDGRFCLFLSFHEPHSPFDFPVEYRGKYDPADMPVPEVGQEDRRWIPAIFRDLSHEDKQGIIAAYYTSVEYLDKNIGLVLDALDTLDLAGSTLVIYVGDHGYLLGHHGRFEKHTMWEQSVRAPLIMRNRSHLPAKKSFDVLVEFIDLVPTILDLLGIPPMKGTGGRSLVPLLGGETQRHREFIFSEFLPDNKAMVRTEEWKYIFTSGKHDLSMGYATGEGAPGITHRLYNLKEDPGETLNLAGKDEYAPVLQELQKTMLERFQETDPRASRLPSDLSIEEALVWFCEPPDPQPAD